MEAGDKNVNKINRLMGALFHLLEASPDTSTNPPTMPAVILENIVQQKLKHVADNLSEDQWGFLEDQCTVPNSETRGWDTPERKEKALSYYYMSGLRQVFGAAANDYHKEIKPIAGIMGDLYVTALGQIYAYLDVATRNYAILTDDSIEALSARGENEYPQYSALIYSAEPSFLKAAMQEQPFEYLNSFFHMFVLREIKSNVGAIVTDLGLDENRFDEVVETTKTQLKSGDMPGMEALKPIDKKEWQKVSAPASSAPEQPKIIWGAGPFINSRQVS